MPTGYTSDIEKGISFKQFILQCSRAFGATISLRDDPISSNIPDKIEPSDYHKKELVRLSKEMKKYNSMTLEEANKLYSQEKKDNEKSCEKYIIQKKNLKKSYENMLKQVHKWIPPTPDHEGLKKFMIEQITESIDFDCKVYNNIHKTKEKSGKEWLKNKIGNIVEQQKYHEENHNEEVERCEKQTKWIQELKKSIEK